MEYLTRSQFVEMFNGLQEGLGGPDSPLWALEDTGEKCQWFVCIKPIAFSSELNRSFWKWCSENCRGRILCFSSNEDDQEEWWGFSDEDDALWWMLKWGQ